MLLRSRLRITFGVHARCSERSRDPATFDLSVGKTFLKKYSVSVTAVNVTNRRVELDNSLTFGGFHWNDPRQLYVEFRYRFHY
jgi:outer membrane receptor protein involved in Fe transport